MKGSTWRWTLWSTRLAGSKPYSWSAGLTSQAILQAYSSGSNLVIRPAPLLLARMFFQLVSTSPPSGVTSPRPVTTTRRIAYSLLENKRPPDWFGKPSCRISGAMGGRQQPRSALILVDIVDRVLDGGN